MPQYQEINQNPSLDALSRLKNIGLAYIDFAIENPGCYRLMFGQAITLTKRSKALHVAAQETFKEFLAAVETFQKETDTESGDLIALANFSWATVHGLATLLIDGQIQLAPDNYGVPTLLLKENFKPANHFHTMSGFAEKILDNYWQMIAGDHRVKF